MCGIFGLITNGDIIDDNKIKKCIETLKARGPETLEIQKYKFNKIDKYLQLNIVLGFTRLAINGLTPLGNQPLYDRTKRYVVVCNGEIYNYKELYNKYNLQFIDGQSDCQVIVDLANKGIDPLHIPMLLDGVFSYILLDLYANVIYVSRDAYGVRPLYIGENNKYNYDEKIVSDGNYIIYASEIKAFPNDACNIIHFEPGTISKINKKYNNNNDTYTWEYITNYWNNIPFLKSVIFNEFEIAMTGIRLGLIDAVNKRMMSERPIGALLSGGLDSSLIAALVARWLNINTGKRLSTFSIGMKGSSDILYAKKVSTFINSIHTEIIVSKEEMLNIIPEVVKNIETYDITSIRASVGNYLIGKYIKENTDIKVVFNGDGSDEIFGGYLYMRRAPNELEFEIETIKLLKNIHKYDVLRSDRCMSSHGLEARTPFLDRQFVSVARSIPINYLLPIKTDLNSKGIEKNILRKAFEGTNLIPDDVLWRRKEAFSDGVSPFEQSWFQIIQEYVDSLEIDITNNYIHNPPKTKEALWYRNIFNKEYPNATNVIEKMWMPNWSPDTEDPSARTISSLYNA